jgi:hypothetical protein
MVGQQKFIQTHSDVFTGPLGESEAKQIVQSKSQDGRIKGYICKSRATFLESCQLGRTSRNPSAHWTITPAARRPVDLMGRD